MKKPRVLLHLAALAMGLCLLAAMYGPVAGGLIGSGDYGVKLHTESVSQLAAFCEQFLRYFGYCSAFYLAIYKYVVHIFLFVF